jgi:hypothetical protein
MTYEVKRKEAQYWHLKTLQLVADIKAGLAIKKPTQKKPQKMGFLNFKFFMKIIQTFLFETDFL